MGDPRRIRSKFESPRHPWEAGRIEEEKKLLREYGLKNKREIWRTDSKLKRFKDMAKHLIAATGAQADKERNQLISRLNRLGLVELKAPLDDVLSLTLKNMLDRRLQTLVFKKGLARTPVQARQFIAHKHIAISNRIISSPGYLVTTAEEPSIQFIAKSSLASAEHPERAQAEKPVEKEVLKKAGKTKKQFKEGKKQEGKAKPEKAESEESRQKNNKKSGVKK